jgi:hypothetical protein
VSTVPKNRFDFSSDNPRIATYFQIFMHRESPEYFSAMGQQPLDAVELQEFDEPQRRIEQLERRVENLRKRDEQLEIRVERLERRGKVARVGFCFVDFGFKFCELLSLYSRIIHYESFGEN